MSKEDLFNAELANCISVTDMFNCIQKYYDCDNTKPSPIVKATVNNGLKSAIKLLRPKLK